MNSWPRKAGRQWVSELVKRLESQDALRAKLASSSPLDDVAARKLDSALKKTTAFMKKVKALSGASAPGLMGDLSKLNLTKFVEEIAQAVAETKLKVSDLAPVVEFCVEVASKYANFPELLLTQIKKNLPLKKSDKVTNPAKLRIDLRFLCELVLCGVFGKEGMQCFGAAITFLTGQDKSDFVNVGLLISLCRGVGWQMAGILPYPEADHSDDMVDVDEGQIAPGPISDAHKKVVYDLLSDYLDALVKKLSAACQNMNNIQKKVKRQEKTRGDASADEKAALDAARTEYEHLKSLMIELTSSFGLSPFEMTEEPSDDEEDELATQEMNRALNEGEISLWPDEETRQFYTTRLDIRSIVPKNLYKESEERTIDCAGETSVDAVDVDGIDNDHQIDDQMAANEKERDASAETEDASSQHEQDVDMVETHLAGEELKSAYTQFVANMEHLMNRDVADEAALDFVSNLNVKTYRKKLVKLLIQVPSNRMDLLPFYARFMAALSPVIPDVAAEVSNSLLKQFRSYIVKPNAESQVSEKVKCSLYIAELVKFELLPRAEGLSCLRELVYDFHGHFIDMACIFLESAGMYLFRNADTYPKMKTILDVILKKKERMKDPRHVMLVENAYFMCVPSESPSKRRLTEPPMMRFIKHLVLNITESTVNSRIKLLRRIDWANDEICDFCLRLLSSPWLLPYSNLQWLACAVAGLINLPNHDWVALSVVDSLIETIRLSLEVPTVFNQQAIACATFIGELYNYSVCDGPAIFGVLYQLISFPEFDEDSWQDFYRIHMVCELLDTIGEYFHSGPSKKKMDYFLVYFSRYFHFKKEVWVANVSASPTPDSQESGIYDDFDIPRFPSDVEAKFVSTYKLLRPRKSPPANLAEAESAVEEIEQELKPQMNFTSEDEVEDPEEDENQVEIHDRDLEKIDELPEEDEDYNNGNNPQLYSDVARGVSLDDDDDDNVHVRVEKSELQPEDFEFQLELDRLLAESYKTNNPQSQAPVPADMSLPSNMMQKMNRQLTFADDVNNRRDEANSAPKVMLMTRGKANKPVLKSVAMEEEELHKAWVARRDKEMHERAVMKRVTLGHTARIMKEEEEEEKAKMVNTGKSKRSNKAR